MRTARALLVVLAAAAAESWIWQPVEAGGQGSAVQVPIFEYDPTFPKPMPETWAIGPIGGWPSIARITSTSCSARRAGENERFAAPTTRRPRPLLHSRAAGAGVRSRRGAGPIVGRARAGLRLAAVRARRLRRSQGQRVAGRQRRQGRIAPEVHAARASSCSSSASRARARAAPTPTNLRRPGEPRRSIRMTNEVYVADGYGNRRVIVLDGDTFAFKRMWGAYGNKSGRRGPRAVQSRRAARAAVPPAAQHRRSRATASSTSPTGRTTASRCSGRTART